MESEFMRAQERLKGTSGALHRFICIYANAGPDGEGLGLSEDLTQVLLFETWVMACAELGIFPKRHDPAAAQARGG